MMIKYLQRICRIISPQILASLILAFVSIQTIHGQPNHAVYTSGEGGYSCFRIPALVSTTKGTLLAFAEARMNGCGDAGDIDLVVKRSSDGGNSWSAMQTVWSDSSNTCGNPAPVIDKKTGNIILLSTWNLGTDHEKDIISMASKDSRRVFVLKSVDDGKSWSTPREITADVKRANWTWYATGPGSGIQIERGSHRGRLVVACDHIESVTNKYYSHVVYSNDHGEHWELGGTTPQDKVNESTIAELPGGELMLNMRNFGPARVRQVAFSKDGGKTFSDLHGDSALPEPVCQASLISKRIGPNKSVLAFSNPANTSARSNMTVKTSDDNGRSWKTLKVLHAGPAAYSNLAFLPNRNLGCLYERGMEKPYEGIFFEEVSLPRISKN